MDNEDDGCSEILKFKLRKDQQAGKIEEKKKDEEISFEMLIQKSIITNQEKIVNAFNNQTSLSLKSTNDTKPEEKKTQSSSTSQKSIENSQPSVASKSKLQENFFEVKKKEAPSTKRKTISEHIAENPAKIPAEVMNKYNILIGCKFCDLIHIHKEKLIYEDDKAAAFHDKRKSSAKEHILVCPKNHLKNTATLTREDVPILVHLEEVGKKLLTQLRPNDEYRFGYHEPPMNSVEHLHLHCFVLPITNNYLNKVIYGFKLAPTLKIIEKIYEKLPAKTNEKSLNKLIGGDKMHQEKEEGSKENGSQSKKVIELIE